MNNSPVPKARRTRVRWMIIGMAFLGTAINYIDRVVLSFTPSVWAIVGTTSSASLLGARFTK